MYVHTYFLVDGYYNIVDVFPNYTLLHFTLVNK